jgi:hypothetical protein
MNRRHLSEEHVPLSVAAAIVSEQTARTKLRTARDLTEALNRAGLALAQLIPLYVFDPQARIARALTAAELLDAHIFRGATELTTADGTTHREITVLRQDMRYAIAMMKGAEGARTDPGVSAGAGKAPPLGSAG